MLVTKWLLKPGKKEGDHKNFYTNFHRKDDSGVENKEWLTFLGHPVYRKLRLNKVEYAQNLRVA